MALELEKLVVKLVADASGYTGVIDKAVGDVAAAAAGIADHAQRALKQQTQVFRQAAKIVEANVPPIQRYLEVTDALKQMHESGAISQEEYNMAMMDARRILPSVAAQEQQRAAAMKEGAKVASVVATAEEKHSAKLRELNSLLAQGAISQETYNRAVAKEKAVSPVSREKADDTRLSQEREAKIANAYVKEHLRALDTVQKQREKDAAAILAIQQKNDAAVAAAYKKSVLKQLDDEKKAREKAAADELRARERQDALIAAAHKKSVLKQIDDAQRAQERAFRDFQRMQRQQESAARRMVAAYRTPFESMRVNIQKLDEAFRSGWITRPELLRGKFEEMRQFIVPVFQSIGTGFQQLGQTVMSFGRKLSMFVTVPIMGLAAASAKAFAEFDDIINRAAAVVGGVSDTMRARMASAAIAMSNAGIVSATDLARGYMHLAQAGLSASQAIETLPVVAKFATAGMLDMEKATEMLIRAQTVLGLRSANAAVNAENMGRVSDVIVKAANISTASIDEFARAIVTKSGAAVRVLGKDMYELVSVLTALANQGTKAELAGEQVYIMLRDMQAAAQKNAAVWKELKISVYDADGQMRHVADILQDLEKLTSGMSDEQVKATMKLLGFTDRSVAATYTLLGMSGAIRDAEYALRDMGDETERVANEIEKSFLSQLKIMWNQVRNVGIAIGSSLAPYLAQINRVISEGLMWWQSLSAEGQSLTLWLVAAVAAAGPLITGFGALLAAIGTAAGLIAAFGTALAGLAAAAAPVVIIIAGIVAAVGTVTAAFAAAAYALYDPKGFIGALESVWNGVTKALRIAQRLLVAFAGWLIGPGKDMFIAAFYNLFAAATKKAMEVVQKFGEAIWKVIKNPARASQAAREFWADIAKDMAAGASNADFTETASRIIEQELGVDLFKSQAEKAWEGYADGLDKGVEDVVGRVSNAAAKIRGGFAVGMDFGLNQAGGVLLGEAKALGRKLGDSIEAGFAGSTLEVASNLLFNPKAKKDFERFMSGGKSQEELDLELKGAANEDEFVKLHEKFKQQVETGATAHARRVTLWKMEELAITDAQKAVLKLAQAEDERLSKIQQILDWADKEAKAYEERERKARSLVEKFMPEEKLKREREELLKLAEEFGDIISPEVLKKALAEIDERLTKTTDKEHTIKMSMRGIDGVEWGSAEHLAKVESFFDQLARDPKMIVTPMRKPDAKPVAAKPERVPPKLADAKDELEGKLAALTMAIEKNTEATNSNTRNTADLAPAEIA